MSRKRSLDSQGTVVHQNSSLEQNNEIFTVKMQIEIIDRMERLMSVSDFLCEECVNDVEYLRDARDKVTESQRRKVDDLLVHRGLTKLFLEIWKKYFIKDFLKDENSLMKNVMNGILWALCNSMAESTALCAQAFESDLHRVVLSYLKNKYLDPSKAGDQNCEDLVYGLEIVLHNMLQKASESSSSLKEQKAFDVFQRFRRSPRNKIACMALIVQLYITEKESELKNSHDSTFIFLKDVLERALMPSNYRRRADGFAPIVVISTLNRLAVNDNNKAIIVNGGLLPLYVKLLQPQCSEMEQEAAAEGLWTLAFKCTHEIEVEPGCMAALDKLAKVNSERLNRLAKGVLWTLEESKAKELSADQISRSGQDGQRHIFISYQWDSQPMIKKLVDSLKEEGFQVWVDYEDMLGSMTEAMAKAVEEAAVVLLCISQKYKESPNCRAEAEYTFRLRKDIISIQLQSDYWPDGWLGLIASTKIMHDFTSDEKYSESIKKLIKELRERGKTAENEAKREEKREKKRENTLDEPDSSVDKVTKASVPTTEPSGGRISIYASWTPEEREQWLHENKLGNFRDWLGDFDGALLIEYKAMLAYTPETFYSMLREKKFAFRDILKLSKTLKQL